jgi:hypothetical protein
MGLYQRMTQRRTPPKTQSFTRETYSLPRDLAREKAWEWFEKFPKAAYDTEVEAWREMTDGKIEFTMRRLPTAD